MDAMMEMGKLNTARIRKATDPKIMDVKRRVRQVRACLHTCMDVHSRTHTTLLQFFSVMF